MMMRFRWILAYAATAFLGLMMAIMVSSAFLSRGHAQDPPPSTDAQLGAGATTTEAAAPGDPNIATPPKAAAPTDEADAVAAAMAAAGATPAETMPPPTTTAAPAKSAAPPSTTKPAPKNGAAPTAPAASAPPAQANPAVPATAAPGAAAVAQAPAAGTAVGSEEYIYEATGRRDPFRRYKAVVTTTGKTMNPSDLDPLLRYDLDQLTLLGILWDVRQPRALIKDVDGGVHTLVKNTKIGRNNGFVATIREGEVVVIETFEEEGGASTKRTRVLELKK